MFGYKFKKRKRLVIGIHKPPSYSENAFIKSLFFCLTNTTEDFDNVLLGEELLEELLNTFSLESLITAPTCFESVAPACIDLILTNHMQYCMKLQALLTGISDCHALTVTIIRNTFCQGNPKTKFYRGFKNFDHEMFESELSYSLQSFQSLDYKHFYNAFLLLLNKYTPIKNKLFWGNHSSFMT